MSLEKIVQEAVEARPLGLKEAFEAEMEKRILAALEEKATASMMEAAADEDEDEDDEDQDDEDDDDEDEEED
jgi:hypothetical protein